jgi:hypothetical protein
MVWRFSNNVPSVFRHSFPFCGWDLGPYHRSDRHDKTLCGLTIPEKAMYFDWVTPQGMCDQCEHLYTQSKGEGHE